MNSLNKTFLPSLKHETRNWFIIDCKGQKLGRLATIIVALLKGKIKPHYHPSVDIGDYIILINADSLILNKKNKHFIVRNPGHPGRSLKIKSVVDSLPQFTIKYAIKRMLAKSETKRLLRRIYIYNDVKHPYLAQNPIKINLSDNNFNSLTKIELNN